MKKILLTCAFAIGLSAGASANLFKFETAVGATVGGQPVDAAATFTTSGTTLQITLSDLLTNPRDVAQLLSDLSFGVAIGDTSLATLTTSSGVERTVAANGKFTDASSVPAGWILSNPSAGMLMLDVLSGPGHAGPAHLIIGPPDVNNLYSAANGSIAGNNAHNPFLANSATFTLTIPGMTADTTINNVVFSFGTTAGVTVPGQPGQPIPDGGTTALLLGAALLSLGLMRRKTS